MVNVFPVPRKELPVIEVSPEERESCKSLAESMLQHTVQEYERFAVVENKQVNSKQWKLVSTRDQLKLYKARRYERRITVNGDLSSSNEERNRLSNSGDGAGDLNDDGSRGSTMSTTTVAAGCLGVAPMMMHGECVGKVENALYAIVTKSHEELALVDVYLHDEVADCAILNVMEAPTEEEPFRFLGYKWFVKKSPTSTHFVKHRDSVYLEYCGITRTQLGEKLGFHLMHSVDLPDFPLFPESVRGIQSLCFLYYQKQDNLTEIFMLGNVNASGSLVKPLATFLASDTLFSITRLLDCAESKRLTTMLRSKQVDAMFAPPQRKPSLRGECSLCNEKRTRFFGGLHPCEVCNKVVCSRCRVPKRVFVSDGILGSFEKIQCCKTCILIANSPQGPNSTLVLGTNKQVLNSHSSGAAQASKASESSPSYHRNSLHAGASSPRGIALPMDRSMKSGRESLSADENPASRLSIQSTPELRNKSRALRARDNDGGENASARGDSSPENDDEVENLNQRMASWEVSRSFYSANSSFYPAATTPSVRTGSQADLLMQMMELNKLAESTYYATKQNEALLYGRQSARQY